ncbi:MAG: hypothetical protein II916_00465 [Oscillospiraceae bacterium]|nr:hypothetical protein [Oscillospiraceae bacterium]
MIGVIGLMALLLAAMVIFFIVALILTLISKPTHGKFLRIIQHEVVGTYAIYEIDGQEYKNTFPAEITFTKFIYREGKTYPVRLFKGKKKYMLYDWYSWIVIGAGLVLSGGLLALLIWAVLAFT